MKKLYITDDKSATHALVVKMTCECGWVEKAFATRDARTRAEHHMLHNHGGGVILYQGHAFQA